MDPVDLVELLLCVGAYEFLNNHVAPAHTDDQLAVEDLSVDLASTEYVVAVAELLNGHRAVGLVDVLADHLIQNVAFWHNLGGSYCHCLNSLEVVLKLSNDPLLVFKITLHLINLLITLRY